MSEQLTIGTDLGTYDAAEVLRGEEVRRMSAELKKLEARIGDMNRDLAEARRWRRWKQDAEDEIEEMEGDLRRAKMQLDKLKAHVSSALCILDAAAEAAREVPDGYALREAVLCAVEALRGE